MRKRKSDEEKIIDKARKDYANYQRCKIKKEFQGEHGKNIKPSVWVGSYLAGIDSELDVCSYCNCLIFYDPKLDNFFDPKHFKICLKCCIDKHLDDLTELEKQRIYKAYNDQTNIQNNIKKLLGIPD